MKTVALLNVIEVNARFVCWWKICVPKVLPKWQFWVQLERLIEVATGFKVQIHTGKQMYLNCLWHRTEVLNPGRCIRITCETFKKHTDMKFTHTHWIRISSNYLCMSNVLKCCRYYDTQDWEQFKYEITESGIHLNIVSACVYTSIRTYT